MNKNKFLSELKYQLRKLPQYEVDEILQDYHEYFTLAEMEGKSEQQIANGLGSPKQIAKELMATHYIEEMEKTNSLSNTMRAVWAALGLGFLNLVFILGPFIGVVGVIVGLWITGFSFIIAPILVLISAVIDLNSFRLFDLFTAIIFSGIGIFVLIGVHYFTSFVKKATIRYLKYNVSIVKGADKNG